MIPQTNTVRVESFGGDVSRSMGIDSASLAHVMRVLSKLYSNPILAVIREYSTNAMDSHIAAGKPTTPIKVSLPNPTHPVLTITDYGTGLTEDEIYGVYGMYGASTKRESNDFNGQLGFGCKSAFSYTDQFTVSATKNGVTHIYVFGMDANGVGSITKMGETLGTQDGVSVSIPVKKDDIYAFSNTAKKFYSFWSVIPDGIEVDSIFAEAPILDIPQGKVYTKPVQSSIVMGNVPYPIPSNILEDVYAELFSRRYASNLPNIQVFVPMGAVQFTPSREELQISPVIKDIVRAAYAGLIEKAKDEVKVLVSGAATYIEAIEIYGKLKARYGGICDGFGKLEYKGYMLDRLDTQKVICAKMENRGLSFQKEAKIVNKNLKYLVAPDWKFIETSTSYYSSTVRAYGIKEKYKRGLRENLGYSTTLIIVNSESEIPQDNDVIGIPVLDMSYMDSIAVVPEKAPRTAAGIGLYHYIGRGNGRNAVASINKVSPENEPAAGSVLHVVELDGYTPTASGISTMQTQALDYFIRTFGHTVYAVRSGNMKRVSKKYKVIPFERALEDHIIKLLNDNKDAAKGSYPVPFEKTENQVRVVSEILGKDTEGYADPFVSETIQEVNYVLTEYHRLTKMHNTMSNEITALNSLIGYDKVNHLIMGFYDTSLESEKAVELVSKYPLLTKLTSSYGSLEDVKDYINSMYKEKYVSV